LEEIREVFVKTVWQLAAEGNWESKVVERCHLHSWASVEGTSESVHCAKGVQAGLPLADLVFCCAMAKVLEVTRIGLSARKLTQMISVEDIDPLWAAAFDIHGNTHCDTDEVSYVDNCAFPVIVPALQITTALADTMACAHETFDALSLEINIWRKKGGYSLHARGRRCERS